MNQKKGDINIIFLVYFVNIIFKTENEIIMITLLIALLTALITILLSYFLNDFRDAQIQKRKVYIEFYTKIRKAEFKIFALILRGNYGWGNPEEYQSRIGQARNVYEKLLNEFYEQLFFDENLREKTKQIILSLDDNIIVEILQSQDEPKRRINADNFYNNDLQKNIEGLRKLYIKKTQTFFERIQRKNLVIRNK